MPLIHGNGNPLAPILFFFGNEKLPYYVPLPFRYQSPLPYLTTQKWLTKTVCLLHLLSLIIHCMLVTCVTMFLLYILYIFIVHMGYYSHTLFFSNKKKNQGKFGPIFSGFEPQNYSYFVLFFLC